MFFIGIFGIKEAQKPIGTLNNVICPTCQSLTRFEIVKTYTYFHIFFIPTFRWNTKYYVSSACCGSIYELDSDIALKYQQGQISEIKNEYLHPVNRYLPDRTCHNCGARAELGYNYCPYCGKEL
jgi:hypothetical protein